MTLQRRDAINEILSLLKAVWDPLGFPMKYDNTHVDTAGATWARATLRHNTGFQATLAGETGQRRFRRTGTLVVQIFQPPGAGLSLNPDLAKIVVDAYEGVTSAGGVIFRDVVPNEIGVDGGFFQTNVSVNFEYDEIK